MKSVLSLLLAPLVIAAPGAKVSSRQVAESIHEAFAGAGKEFFGTATDKALLERDANAAIIKADFGQVTPENSMKWGLLEAKRGTYTWDGADFLADWATENGKVIRGHTLIWHSQLPSWVHALTDADELRKVIRDHVTAVVGRYAGKVAHWDVVNEIFNSDGSLRSSVFARVLGEEFVSIAFKAAHEADPNAKLWINDYNLDSAGDAKVKAIVSFVEKLVGEGVPIDGIGSQTHLAAGKGAGIQAALEQLATAPVDHVAITELDIAGAPVEDYTAVVSGCLNVAKCSSITVWGVSDSDSWRPEAGPLLFDGDFQPKDAYNAILEVL